MDMGILTSIWVYTHETKQPELWNQLELDISNWLRPQPAPTPFQLEPGDQVYSVCTQQAMLPVQSRQYQCKSIHCPSSLATARQAELEEEDHGARNQPGTSQQPTSHITYDITKCSSTVSISHNHDVIGVSPMILA